MDRIATSVDVALRTYPDGTSAVVIAHAYGYPDALAGGPLAAELGAPILLSGRGALPDVVADAIQTLDADEAVLLGGTDALSQQVADDLEALGLEVSRIGGATRFHTAANIAERVGGDHVYVTEGQDPDPNRGWPDAMSVSPLASFQQRPILLVTTDELPEATTRALGGRIATIVGGEAAVSPAVEERIIDVSDGLAGRIAGSTRYGTSLAVNRAARDAGMDAASSWFATGQRYPDALTAGPAVAAEGSVLVLVAPTDVSNSPATVEYVHEVNLVLETLRIVGGEHAISETVVEQLEAAARHQG